MGLVDVNSLMGYLGIVATVHLLNLPKSRTLADRLYRYDATYMIPTTHELQYVYTVATESIAASQRQVKTRYIYWSASAM